MPVEDAHGHDVEGEEGADGDQVEQAVEGREESNDGCANKIIRTVNHSSNYRIAM
jgi:hypothetical protein